MQRRKLRKRESVVEEEAGGLDIAALEAAAAAEGTQDHGSRGNIEDKAAKAAEARAAEQQRKLERCAPPDSLLLAQSFLLG